MTHRLIALVLLLAASNPAAAQHTPSNDTLKLRLKKKACEDWLSHVDWQRDYDALLTRMEGRADLILAYFSRSYAP